jgi:DNA-binding protein HU-beta
MARSKGPIHRYFPPSLPFASSGLFKNSAKLPKINNDLVASKHFFPVGETRWLLTLKIKGGNMTKAELIERVAKECKIPKATAERAINAVTDNISKCLKKKDKITLTGFGTFQTAKRRARTGRNPQTGAMINIKAAIVPRFKPGKQLKNSIQ